MSVLALPGRLLRVLREEVRGWLALVIVTWPNTSIGYVLRRAYWRHQTGANDILVARGARLIGCEHIRFGERLAIGENVEFVADGADGLSVYIGSNILFARGVYLRSSNHALEDRGRRILEQGHVSKRVEFGGGEYSVVVEDDSWIGANVIVLSGAHIGRGAVIGAGSVVTGVIPPFTVAAGAPARVITERK